MSAPKYRADIKGQVAEIKRDFAECIRNELTHGENFLFHFEDCAAYDEYKDMLTESEMKSCWKTATQH